jgi:cob(I)alamin adenosyltransferase
MKVYTKTGDDGTTGLFFAGRAAKDDVGPRAYGDVDEAVSALGIARAACPTGSELDALLVRLQRELFVVGAELATAPENRHKLKPGQWLVTAEMVGALEPIIDDVTARFEMPQEFVLPGQNAVAAGLDLARSVVRRAERSSVTAVREGWIPPASEVVRYLNRLSDLCWTLARWQEGEFLPARTDRESTSEPRPAPEP